MRSIGLFAVSSLTLFVLATPRNGHSATTWTSPGRACTLSGTIAICPLPNNATLPISNLSGIYVDGQASGGPGFQACLEKYSYSGGYCRDCGTIAGGSVHNADFWVAADTVLTAPSNWDYVAATVATRNGDYAFFLYGVAAVSN